jgi:hypothetical protein
VFLLPQTYTRPNREQDRWSLGQVYQTHINDTQLDAALDAQEQRFCLFRYSCSSQRYRKNSGVWAPKVRYLQYSRNFCSCKSDLQLVLKALVKLVPALRDPLPGDFAGIDGGARSRRAAPNRLQSNQKPAQPEPE